MRLVARRVREVREQRGLGDDAPAEDLRAFRERPAWVLLGESLGEGNFASGFEGPSLDRWYVYNQ